MQSSPIPLTKESITWDSEKWNQVGSMYSTPNITSILQKIVNNPDWKKNGAMAFVFKKSSFKYSTNTCIAKVNPSLEIEYIPQVTARGNYESAGEDKEHAFDKFLSSKWLDFLPQSWIQYNYLMSSSKNCHKLQLPQLTMSLIVILRIGS